MMIRSLADEMIVDRFNQIPRIEAPSVEEFHDQYLGARQPVILRNALAGQPICDLESLDDVAHQMGDEPIVISEGFRPFLFDDAQPTRQSASNRQSTMAEFIQLLSREPDTSYLCSENELPKAVAELCDVPEYCDYGDLINDAIVRFFVGGCGNSAHLHCDGDFRHVLFYQAVGSKRIIIFPPESSPKLAPKDHNSLHCLEHFSESEKDAFVQYAGGVQCILNAGEALFFPAAVWHYVEYLTPGVSVAFRFGRNRYTQFLGDCCHMNHHLQSVGARLTDESRIDDVALKAFEIIEQAYRRPTQSGAAKVHEMAGAYKRAWQTIDSRKQTVYQIPSSQRLNDAFQLSSAARYQHLVKPASSSFNGWDVLEKMSRVEPESSAPERFDYMQRVMLGKQAPVRSANADQRPAVYCPGLTDKAWHDTAKHSWIQDLESNYKVIKQEFLDLRADQTGYQPYREPGDNSVGQSILHDRGNWDVFYFYFEGRTYEANCQRCPQTFEILKRIPRVAGMACFSGLAPETHIKPHCGPFNITLRCHLGLQIPESCRMRVGAETRTWAEGKCVLFDDTFEHEVWNDADDSRFVLLFDVYHPDLSDDEVTRLQKLWTSDAARAKLQAWWDLIECQHEDAK